MCALTFTKIEEERAAFCAFVEVLDEVHTLAICAHTNPDGDALGSELALARILSKRWPEMSISCLLADHDECPRIYRFLDGASELMYADELEAQLEGPLDCFFVVDLSSYERLNEAKELCKRAAKKLVLDHHPHRDIFWDVALVRPDAAAAGVLVKNFADYLGVGLDEGSANALFCALLTDTGRFQYQNTNAEAFQCASALVDAGADPNMVAERVYQSDKLNYLKLEALALSRVELSCNGKIASSYTTLADLERFGVSHSDCDGLIDAVRRVDGAELILFLKEIEGGRVRGSLRAKGDKDVSVVAAAFGGGGHKAAAGFTFEGSLEEAREELLAKLTQLFD